MTQPAPPCVLGCTEPIRDVQTNEKLGDAPRPAHTGNLCKRCATQLHTWIRDIGDLYAQLDVRKGSAGSPFSPAKRQKVSGSPALIRLDVAILQDPRSTSGAWYRGERVREPEDINDPPSDIPGQYIAWADSLADDVTPRPEPTDDDEDDEPPSRFRNLTDALDFLTGGWFENLCYQTWVEDIHEDTRTTRQLLRRLTGTSGPRPIGKCDCGQVLYAPDPNRTTQANPDGAIVECRNCGHRLNSLAIIRLAATRHIDQDGAA